MKNIIKLFDKQKINKSFLIRSLTNVIWILIALLFLFINENTTKVKLVFLILTMIILFVISLFLKKYYSKNKNETFYGIKHSLEVNLFKRINNIDRTKIYNLDKESLSNKILQFSFNVTKMIYDIEAVLIPLLIYSLVIFAVTAKISIILALIITIVLITTIVFRYKNVLIKDESNWINYNDLLKDFILKFNTIKKINIFDYCLKKIEANKESDLLNLREDYNEDQILSYIIYASGIVIVISLFIKFKALEVILGYLCFYIIVSIKYKSLVYKAIPAVKNILKAYSTHDELEKLFEDSKEEKIINNFKTIEIKNLTYESNESPYSIRVDNFEIEARDSISIMGKPGQGKSTILNCLSGMYKPSSGEILVDNEPIDGALDLAHISFNNQMFKLSLRENLILGKKVSDEVILQYIDEVGLSEWFGRLGNGLDTILDENYIDINEEELIKLNIVRAIVLDKVLYLIDDFGNYLDIDSEKNISEMIKKYLRKKTFIIVAHKPIFTTICKKHYFIKNHTLLEKETLL